MNYKLPEQRWEINNPDREIINQLVQTLGVSPIIAQILFNRNLKTTEDARSYIDPESEKLPSLLAEFPDLEMSVELLKTAIQNQKKIGLCGNYTADGMTSTALLLIALKHLGADVTYVIPSQKDGYGINERIVKEFDYLLISLIITVDHGISAYEPIELARDLDIDVIITDHHDLPENLPPANAILNPKLSTENSPYRTLVGVGVAYILAVTLAQELDLLKGLTAQLLELFTLGTIADIALVNGVNRRWLKRGLKLISQSQIKGVQALMQISGISQEHQEIKADDIRNILAPRISAVGEISDPEIMIELLTTEDESIALERAMQCEQIYLKRERICEKIAQEAIEIIDNTPINWQEKRVLLIVKAGWHIGVLLIVAFRLKNRYGVPVFICTYDEENPKIIRGSARGIDEFNVFSALYYCQDLLGKYGGHKAAGGFSFPAGNLAKFEERLSEFAHQCLEPHHLKPLVKIDTQLNFNQINQELYEQLDQLQPWGINNNEPVFWTPQVRIIEQRNNNNKFTLNLCQEVNGKSYYLYGYISDNINILNVPCLYVDIAYKIKQYTFVNNKKNIELEIIGIRPSYINLSETNMINEKVRIYDLSKELNLKNKDILDICEILNISVKSHSSLLTEEQAQLIRLATNRYKEIFIENQQNKTNLENNELEIESKGEITQLIIPAKNQNQYPDDYLEFEKFVKNQGYSYEDSVLRRVWTQTMNNEARFTILAGSPGSGKTLLVSLLAEFFNRDLENYQSTYLLQPVSPSWFSSESLLGIYSQINHQFYPTGFLRFLEIAEKHQHLQRKFFACLDEFNLAQPEQYLAKILSVMESNDKKIIVCDQEKREVCLNSNLKLFATINTDSASKKLSPKVLDRSIIINVIPLPEKVLEYAKNFGQKDNINLSKIFEELQKNWLEQLLNLGKSAKSSFGYRTIKSVFSYIQYHPYTQDNTVISDEKIKAILDELICSFFLAKLPGLPDWEYNNDYSQQLEEIANNLKQAKLENAQNMINNIRQGYPGESAF